MGGDQKQLNIPLKRVDFHRLAENYGVKFDTVVCLVGYFNLHPDAARILHRAPVQPTFPGRSYFLM